MGQSRVYCNPMYVCSTVAAMLLLCSAISLSTVYSAGLLDSEIALDLSRYLVNEREYIPWAAALKWFHILSERLSLTALYGKYTVSYSL